MAKIKPKVPITYWAAYTPAAHARCGKAFKRMLVDIGAEEVDSSSLFETLVGKWCWFLKRHGEKSPRVFVSRAMINQIVYPFSRAEGEKWFKVVLEKKTMGKTFTRDQCESILVWVALRYNFYLAQELPQP
jgi:hypothetical protein